MNWYAGRWFRILPSPCPASGLGQLSLSPLPSPCCDSPSAPTSAVDPVISAVSTVSVAPAAFKRHVCHIYATADFHDSVYRSIIWPFCSSWNGLSFESPPASRLRRRARSYVPARLQITAVTRRSSRIADNGCHRSTLRLRHRLQRCPASHRARAPVHPSVYVTAIHLDAVPLPSVQTGKSGTAASSRSGNRMPLISDDKTLSFSNSNTRSTICRRSGFGK